MADIVVIVAAVFLGFMAIGVPLPALPVFIHDQLGCGGLLVGWVIATQSIATLVTRPLAARLSDDRSPRVAAIAGLGGCAAAATLYLFASLLSTKPAASLAVLFAGRSALGLGESLLITGALAWGIGLAGPGRAGKVMAWVGIAMYGALAVGAPLGGALLWSGGFLPVAVAAASFPLAGIAVSGMASPVAGAVQPPVSFL
ncbi:MAG: MFS transporter, partial [Bradyrhizobium sp.]|nr:MFS transporter [Bradyrhizobium sp.]